MDKDLRDAKLNMPEEKSMKEDVTEKAYKLAHRYEREHHGCAESTLLSLQETFGLKDDLARKSASGLLAGIAFMGSTCGALVGGIMALGMKYGRVKITDPVELQLDLFESILRLRDKFEKEFGSCLCRDIQKSLLGRFFNLFDLYEYEEFKKAGGYDKDKCPEVVGKTARMVAELLKKE